MKTKIHYKNSAENIIYSFHLKINDLFDFIYVYQYTNLIANIFKGHANGCSGALVKETKRNKFYIEKCIFLNF
jgi:hypothetical protein